MVKFICFINKNPPNLTYHCQIDLTFTINMEKMREYLKLFLILSVYFIIGQAHGQGKNVKPDTLVLSVKAEMLAYSNDSIFELDSTKSSDFGSLVTSVVNDILKDRKFLESAVIEWGSDSVLNSAFESVKNRINLGYTGQSVLIPEPLLKSLKKSGQRNVLLVIADGFYGVDGFKRKVTDDKVSGTSFPIGVGIGPVGVMAGGRREVHEGMRSESGAFIYWLHINTATGKCLTAKKLNATGTTPTYESLTAVLRQPLLKEFK